MTSDDEQWLEQFLQTTPRRRQAILYKALHATGLRIGVSLDKEIESLSRAAAENSGSMDEVIAQQFDENSRQMVEEQTWRHFGIGVDEFARRWHAGEITEDTSDEAMRVAMLLPFAGVSLSAKANP